MSKIISRDDVDNCESWAPPAVEPPRSGTGGIRGAPVNTSLLTASQLERLQQQAYEEAYEVGLREGRAAGQQQTEARAQELVSLLQALAEPFAQLDDKVEQQLVDLVIAMVRQLVRREIKSEPGQVVAVVREAMSALPIASSNISVHLHPEDAALVRESLSLSDEDRSWKVVDDLVMSRGGCRVTTEYSQIDATIDSRVAQLIAKVFGGQREGDS